MDLLVRHGRNEMVSVRIETQVISTCYECPYSEKEEGVAYECNKTRQALDPDRGIPSFCPLTTVRGPKKTDNPA